MIPVRSFPGGSGALVLGLILSILLCRPALPAEAQESGPEFVMKLAAVAPEGTSWADTAGKFKQYVEDKSGGRVRVVWYLGQIMGDEPDVFLKMRLGYLQGGGFTGAGLGTMVPELFVLTLPFLFQDYGEVDEILEKMTPRFQRFFEKQGFILAGWLEAGLLYWFTQKPVQSIDDFKQQRMWLWKADPVNTLTNETLGFQEIRVTFPNVLEALQTGEIDSLYGIMYGVVTLQWYTKLKYIIEPHYSYTPAAIVMDKKFFDALPADIQKIVMEAWAVFLPPLKKIIREDNRKSYRGMVDRGMKPIQLDPKTVETLKRITFPVYQKSTEQFFPEWLLKETLGILREYRKQNSDTSQER